jgi:hypothetical protein
MGNNVHEKAFKGILNVSNMKAREDALEPNVGADNMANLFNMVKDFIVWQRKLPHAVCYHDSCTTRYAL